MIISNNETTNLNNFRGNVNAEIPIHFCQTGMTLFFELNFCNLENTLKFKFLTKNKMFTSEMKRTSEKTVQSI